MNRFISIVIAAILASASIFSNAEKAEAHHYRYSHRHGSHGRVYYYRRHRRHYYRPASRHRRRYRVRRCNNNARYRYYYRHGRRYRIHRNGYYGY
ncbi:hypothetical protein VB711_12485 [Cronbergia sp. UHCC 0137]|uniref:hypothetical protein n=1 Tax=Cronbergia sp. UHCC 0137 TaxID=3110239 RepID=UPI002B20EB2C|nr:hypothetical protein [Cronbergia sp. UHCC 0137]MEA5618648.1 hypothetical protein [Cronbergia sp. UHCC 0137]